MTSRFENTTTANVNNKSNTNSNSTGFGLRLALTGNEPEHVGIFINIQKDSIAEQLILNDDGSFDLDTLSLLLSIAKSKGEVYQTGTRENKVIDKQKLLEKLLQNNW